MTAREVGDEQVRAWVKAREKQTHATVVQTRAWAVRCVVVAQRVTLAALALQDQATLCERSGNGFQR